MAITTIYTYPLDGTQREFNVPFEYLARRFVVLTLIGTNRKELVLTSDYRFVSKTAVSLNASWGPAQGYERLEIRRNTSATDRLVDFADGSILRASELNISQIQTLHVAEEARNMVADTISTNNDGDLDARGRRLVNLADAVEPGDAITLRQQAAWADSALNSSAKAKDSETKAKASELAAKDSETKAKASELAAKDSETNAKASELAAKDSETNAKVSGLAAKDSETKAKVSELAAKDSEAVSVAKAAEAAGYAAGMNMPSGYGQGGKTLVQKLDETGLFYTPYYGASFRNKIINGRMDVSQRGTSFVALQSGKYFVDRWRFSNLTGAVVTGAQLGGNGLEFYKSAGVTVTTPDTSIASGDVATIEYFVEGYEVYELVGKTFCISFWVCSPKAGTHCLSLVNSGADRSYVAAFTVNSANTWEYKIVRVDGGLPSSGTWNFSNGIGLGLRFALAAGAAYQGSAGSWLAGNIAASVGQVNCLDSPGGTYAITGVQLESGPIATPFEHRPVGFELSLCQRYYEQAAVNAYTNNGTSRAINGSNVALAHWKATKRATPVLSKQDVYLSNVWSATANYPTLSSGRVVIIQDAAGGMEYIGTLYADAELYP